MEPSWLITAVLGAILLSIITWLTVRNRNYWKNYGIKYIKSPPLLGIMNDLFLMRKSFNDIFLEIYKRYEGEKFVGYFQFITPSIMIRDPELINHILVKDFSHFVDRSTGQSNSNDLFSRSLGSLSGEEWRNIRNKLSPTFSSIKMKSMVEIIKECSDNLVKYLRDKVDQDFDVNDLMQKVIFNITARIAFGLDIDTLNEKDTSSAEFLKNSSILFNPSFFAFFKFLLTSSAPTLSNIFRLKLTDAQVDNYFRSLTKNAIHQRKTTGVRRNDFLQLMLDESEKEKGSKTEVFTEDFIAAQAFIFISGGSETIATVLQFVLFELGTHQDLQKRVQDEIAEVLSSSELNYEATNKFKYMEQFINETLRIHTIAPTLIRSCTSDYKIPGTEVIIKKGNSVHISAEGLHMDPQYFHEPEIFNPDRFQDKDAIPKNVFIPFGSGPRMCIGTRLATLEMKVLLAVLLSNYTISLNKKTDLPLKYSKSVLLIHVKGKIWINFHKRQISS